MVSGFGVLKFEGSPSGSRFGFALRSCMEDLEATEDPLRDPNAPKILNDEEEEAGAGIDYRRMFKG
jgi:hypothetical protein